MTTTTKPAPTCIVCKGDLPEGHDYFCSSACVERWAEASDDTKGGD